MRLCDFTFWWETDTYYLGTLKFLAGVDESLILAQGEYAKHALRYLKRNMYAVALRDICRLRHDFIAGQISEDAAMSRLYEISASCDGVLKFHQPSIGALSEAECCISYLCGMVVPHFPSFVSVSDLRSLFVRGAPGTGTWANGSLNFQNNLEAVTTDQELFVCWFKASDFDTLVEERWSCIAQAFGNLTDTVVIVDGENVQPESFFIFALEISCMADYLSKPNPLASVKIEILSNARNIPGFEFVLCSLNLFAEVSVPERILTRKSLVDFKLVSRAFRNFFECNIKNFVVLSSDSDFWILTEEMPGANIAFVCDPYLSSRVFRDAVADSSPNSFICMDASLGPRNHFSFRAGYLTHASACLTDEQILDKELWSEWVDSIWGYKISNSRAAIVARERSALRRGFLI